jgi:hypothetical protein
VCRGGGGVRRGRVGKMRQAKGEGTASAVVPLRLRPVRA